MDNKAITPEVMKPEVARADEAHALYTRLLKKKEEIATGYLDMGEIFLEIRDQKYYEALGHDSFASFYGSPEIGFAKTTVYAMIDIYKLLIVDCGYSKDRISEIPWSKLNMTKALLKKAKDQDELEDLLFKAKELSQKDLIDEVRVLEGKPPKEYTPPEHERPELLEYEDYLDFVRAYGCILCPSKQADPHHFPQTRGAGAPDHWVIPLCRQCHSTVAVDIDKFLKTYRNQIFKYFYDIILTIYKTIYGEKDDSR